MSQLATVSDKRNIKAGRLLAPQKRLGDGGLRNLPMTAATASSNGIGRGVGMTLMRTIRGQLELRFLILNEV